MARESSSCWHVGDATYDYRYILHSSIKFFEIVINEKIIKILAVYQNARIDILLTMSSFNGRGSAVVSYNTILY